MCAHCVSFALNNGQVDLNQTMFQMSQQVAFPPLDSKGSVSQMMALHWNVAANYLIMALFLKAKRRI